ncbi:MAG: nickel pincer cofactor biosynthesis protein LarB [Acidimicrobiia bacterium]|nr:nickel pincer cofactor biosynthesis protein LarB [Acidimicrobiia bacterium]
MDEQAIRNLVAAVADGTVDADEAVARLRALPYDVGDGLRLDHHRSLRTGMAETVYAPGKTPTHVATAVGRLLAASEAPVVVSRAGIEHQEAAFAAHPGGVAHDGPCHSGQPTATLVWRPAAPRVDDRVLVCAAGTSDLPVAEEAVAVLGAMGVVADVLVDVGVAGLHRLLPEVRRLQEADVVVVVAGMEGALASVAGGLTSAPVVAVPTSTGYGSSLEGVTALLAMTSSCAAGVTVVGIDNGFGAATAALRMLSLAGRRRGGDGRGDAT